MTRIRPSVLNIDTNTSRLYWLTTEYIYNRGGDYRPSLEDMIRKVPVTTTDLFNTAAGYVSIAENGSLVDTYIDQYTNRLYSTYLYSRGKTTVPVSVGWDHNITINNNWNGNTYQVYQDDTSSGKTRTSPNLSLNLGEGLNRLDVMLYTDTANSPFSLHVDLGKVYFDHIPQLMPCIAEGNIDYTVTDTLQEDSIGDSSGCNFFVRRALIAIWDISDNATPGYSANFDSLVMYVKGQSGWYPDPAESSGNGFIIAYSGPTGKTLSVIGRWLAFGVRLG